MSLPDNALETGIFNALSSDASLGALLSGTAAVYANVAPFGVTEPFVIYNQQASTPAYTMNGVSYENLLYQIKGITVGESSAAAGSVADAIDDVLQDGSVSVSGYGLMYFRRESGVAFTEFVEGKRYNHRGAIYRVMLDPT